MASLFIKDNDTAALAASVAEQLGTTKTEAVRRGLKCLEVGTAMYSVPFSGSTADWLREYRARRPLPDQEVRRVNKAFYDWLSDEENVVDPWAS